MVLSKIEDISVKDYLKIEPVGSRRTCVPAPEDTDNDYLILVKSFEDFNNKLTILGYTRGGSAIDDYLNFIPKEARFRSYTYLEFNLIVCESEEFFNKFMLATNVCKKLNLLVKSDRIALFQAILYGNFIG